MRCSNCNKSFQEQKDGRSTLEISLAMGRLAEVIASLAQLKVPVKFFDTPQRSLELLVDCCESPRLWYSRQYAELDRKTADELNQEGGNSEC